MFQLQGVYHSTERCGLRTLTGKKASSNENLTFMEGMNMDIRVVGTTNQLFKKGSSTETKFSIKKK